MRKSHAIANGGQIKSECVPARLKAKRQRAAPSSEIGLTASTWGADMDLPSADAPEHDDARVEMDGAHRAGAEESRPQRAVLPPVEHDHPIVAQHAHPGSDPALDGGDPL